MFNRGLVIGKFYPPHRGHKHLIERALAETQSLVVIVCEKDTETIPGALRAKWLQAIHPAARVMLLTGEMPGDDDSQGWARYTIDLLGYAPDAVFTSEDYGARYAAFMGAQHVSVDAARKVVPISATMVRTDPERYAEFLEPCVRAWFVKRIVILGAESTGTTTLARDLAAHFKTVWVPEYGRFYSEGKVTAKDSTWRTEEFITIAQAQQDMEDALAQHANGLVTCDTDAFATSVWHERYLERRSAAVEAIDKLHRHDFYIVTGDEIPFVQDSVRDGELIRHWLHDRFIARLVEAGKPHIVVTGSREARLERAIAAIAAVMQER
jgi:NadR type nicotinamide-nucleotide adenylyltransferase